VEIILLLTIGAIFLTTGDIIAKKWVLSDKKYWYFLTLLFYIIGLNFLIASYRFEDIAVASITLEILNITILTLVGIRLYKEKISKTELTGIILGIISIIILEI